MRRREYRVPIAVALLLMLSRFAGAQASWPAECTGRLEPPAQPVTFGLPLEVDGGAALDRETPAPFIAWLSASPTFRLSGGKFELGPSVAVAYLNPKFEGLAGARAAVRIWNVALPEAVITTGFVSVDGLWGTREARQVLGAVRGDLGGVLILSFFAGRDFGRHETLLGVRVGTDLTWLRNKRRQTSFHPPPAPPAVDEPRPDYYGYVSTVAQRDALDAFFVRPRRPEDPEPARPPQPLAAAMRGFLQSQRFQPLPGSIGELAERLPGTLAEKLSRSTLEEGIRRAARMAAFENVPVPAQPDEGQLVSAIVRGWCRATALVE